MRVFLEEERQFFIYQGFDQALDFAVAEFGLGLPLELAGYGCGTLMMAVSLRARRHR